MLFVCAINAENAQTTQIRNVNTANAIPAPIRIMIKLTPIEGTDIAKYATTKYAASTSLSCLSGAEFVTILVPTMNDSPNPTPLMKAPSTAIQGVMNTAPIAVKVVPLPRASIPI